MTTAAGEVTPQWLHLRGPADATARSRVLAGTVRRGLAPDTPIVVHDLGCGSGSMGRWLAPLLPGGQHWVLHDRDAAVLEIAEADPPVASGAVTVETRAGDITGLRPEDLAGASLITASALLDIMTAEELERLVRLCVAADCPSLLTLSVTGRVRLLPADPLDEVFGAAFNDHQRRSTAGRTLLGPDAARAAGRLFTTAGARVEVDPSPWRLDGRSPALIEAWLVGWVGAACEQRPELATAGGPYLERRRSDLENGRLAVTVHHVDLLARPRGAA